MKTVKLITVLLVGLFIISSCSKETLTGVEELAPANQLTLADIKVTAQDGVLNFETSDDFLLALDILDTISMETRIAWEQNLGFSSIRAEYDKALEAFDYDENFNASDFKEFVGFDNDLPFLFDYTKYFSSGLNKDGYVIVNNALGSVRRDGCFWANNKNETDLATLIKKKKHDPDNGFLAFIAPEMTIDKACTNGMENSSYSEFHRVDNGNSRGSTRLSGDLDFEYYVSSYTNPQQFVAVKVFFRMQGISERRGRRRWSRNRQNHTFNWSFVVNHVVYANLPTSSNPTILSFTPTTYSGSETHNNNEVAVKEIIIEQRNTNGLWAQNNRFVLDRVNTGSSSGGTKQTVQDLNPQFVSYGCN